MGTLPHSRFDSLEKEPQVRRELFGVRLLILHFKFQFSESIKSSTFHIFFNLTYPFRKKISFKKCQKISQKFTQNRKTLVNVLNGGIWCCLKLERNIDTKATLSDVKTTFGWNPALTCKVQKSKKKATPTYVRRANLFLDSLRTEFTFSINNNNNNNI